MKSVAIRDSNLALTTLDADTLKQSLKNYLKSQDIFRGYDFESSNLSVLLSLLAYNTSTLAFFTNMNFSENWIDSAQLRDSLSSHAKSLNYLPRSARSPVARVKVTFSATGASQPYVVAKGSGFTTQINNKSYQYTLDENVVISSKDNDFEFEADIYEGNYLKDSYIHANVNQRFKITNKNVDTRSIVVTVFEDKDSEGTIYTYASTLLGLTERSRVFFLQPAENGYFEVVFGDGIIGKIPADGSLILIDYRVTEGPVSNGAKVFSCNFDPANGEVTTGIQTITVAVAENGYDQESNESIKYYAPRHFQVQERAVVEDDYEISLKTRFPELNAVTVFGGEKLDPPKFGKVFIAVDITGVDGLPVGKIEQYTNFIKQRNTLTLVPVFIDPDFLYWGVRSKILFNLNVTDVSSQRIRSLAIETILKYNEDNLDDFKSTMRFSKFSTAIDDTDTSIISNSTDLFLYKKISPTLQVTQNIDVSFKQAIESGSVSSSVFVFRGSNCTLADKNGNLIIQSVKNSRTVSTIGQVNYKRGLVRLINFNPSSYRGNSIKVYATPSNKDIFSEANDILTTEADELDVSVVARRL